MATDYLSALNVGSGLNTTEIIDALVTAERTPKEDQINGKIEERNVSISALGQVKTALANFDASLATINDLSSLSTNSSSSAINLTITDGSTASTFNHNIEIATLAKAQTLVFGGFTSQDQSLGAGSLAISFGTWSGSSFTQNATATNTLSISSGSDTLSDVCNTINDAAIGLTASIVKTDNNAYSLMIKSSSGVDNAMHIVATELTPGSGLAGIDYSSHDVTKETVAASDAALSLDGVAITRDNNTITDLIDGVSLTLNDVTSSVQTISARHSASDALLIMQALVDEMNTFGSKLRELSLRGTNGAESGPLVSDPSVASLKRSLRNITTNAIYGYADTPLYMANFGIMTERDGSITLDAAKFKSTFDSNPDNFQAIIKNSFSVSTSSVSASVSGTNWTPGTYALTVDGFGNATIDGDTMTLSNGVYSSYLGNTKGLALEIGSGVTSASVYMGRSSVGALRLMADQYLKSNNILDTKINSYRDDVTDYQEDLNNLDEKMEIIRANYVERYARMDTLLQMMKSTEQSLSNMMDAWRGSMNG